MPFSFFLSKVIKIFEHLHFATLAYRFPTWLVHKKGRDTFVDEIFDRKSRNCLIAYYRNLSFELLYKILLNVLILNGTDPIVDLLDLFRDDSTAVT